MKSRWMTHKGKKIFFADYSHLNLDELKAEISSVEPILCSQPKDSVLCVADVSGTYGTPEAMNSSKVSLQKQNLMFIKGQSLELSVFRRLLLKAVNQFSGQETVPFDNVDKALDWLVQGLPYGTA